MVRHHDFDARQRRQIGGSEFPLAFWTGDQYRRRVGGERNATPKNTNDDRENDETEGLGAHEAMVPRTPPRRRG
jgi:hypothetical protein